MQNVSSSYLEKIKEPSRSFECRVTIGNNVYTNADIINISIEDVQPTDGFTIGAAVSKSLELTLSTNNIIYSNSKVKLEIGLNIGSTFEYILIGHFHIEDIISTDYSTKLTCYDNMIKFEKPYFSNLGKTSSLKNIINELATITGVEFTGSLPSYNLNKLEGFTCREILGFVASICGGNAYITREGKFTIKTPETIDYSITSDNYIDLKSEEDLYKVGAITCKSNDKELTKGTLSNSSMEITFENPWVTESILTDIYNKLKGFEFIGYSMKWQGDFSLDVGDIISITDTKGNTRQVPIFSQKFTYNGGLTSEIGAKGESKTKNEFSPTGDLNNKVNRIVTDLLIVNKALINKADIEDLKAVNAEIENLIAVNVTITGKLSAIEGEFETIKSDVATIGNLTVTHTAQINDLIANSATITQLEAVSAQIGIVEADVGKINTLLAGNLTGENFQAGGITSDKLTIANGFITNAMIANLDVSKINAGDISTNKFRIKSDNGGIEIVGATQQFKDKNNKVRIQMGQDTQGNFNFIIRGEDGTSVLIDHTGIKEKAIADDLIKETMIAQDAIGEKQINYSSFITGFNKDTNTNTIKSTKIMLNNQNQTLDVAFSQLKTQADGTKELTESHSTTIGVMQGQISTAINNTQIVKDGQTILLKDDYNRTIQTIDSMKSTIGSHATTINEHTGQITGVQTKTNELERSISNFSSRLETTEAGITDTNNKVSAIEQNLDVVTFKVSTVEQNQTSINGQVSTLQNKMSDVESKITKNAITNLVRESFYTKDEINSKGYQTESQVQQTVNAFELKFTQTGGYNIVENSTGYGNNKNGWGNTSNGTEKIYTGLDTGVKILETGYYFRLQRDGETSTSANAGVSRRFKLKHNTTYTVSAKITSSTNAAGIKVMVRTSDTISYTEVDNRKDFDTTHVIYNGKPNGWQKVSLTFTTGANVKSGLFYIDHLGYIANDTSINTNRVYWGDVCIYEGSIDLPWSPHPNEVYGGITSIDRDGITVTSSNVRSKTTMSANGFKITKTDTNTDVFKVNSDGRLSLIGEFMSYNGNRKSGYFGMDTIKFYNWWSDTNEEIAYFYGGKTNAGKRSADIIGKDMVSLGIGAPSNGKKVLEANSSVLYIYTNVDFNNAELSNVHKINYNGGIDTWINQVYIRYNQLNTNRSGGYLNLNYWKGGNVTGNVHVKIGNGNNDDAFGSLSCGNFKATGTKNCIVETTVGYVGINAYETAECYFGDIGETTLDNNGYSYVYIDSIFTETVNTQRKYQVFLSIYGEGTANVVERTPVYFVIKGTPGLEVGYELKAKRKGYEDHRLEREVNNWKIGENHGLDEEYNHERVDFDKKIENIINEEVIKDIENETLQEFISSEVERSIENIELLKTIEEDILNEDIN